MSTSNLMYPDPNRPIYMNWLPADARHALSIFDRGGPLVDCETGQVVVLSAMRASLWSQLVQLPEGAWLEGRPEAASPAARPAASFEQAARAAWQAEAVAA
jgi:hypothetical protein